jgi:hypothetical protein
MQFEQHDIETAFRLFLQLMQKGRINAEDEGFRYYAAYDKVRSLMDIFAYETDSVVLKTSDHLYLVPLVGDSPFQMKNAHIKREFLGWQATNLDIYLMYFCIIVFFGEFYDSYETTEATRDFLPVSEWLTRIKERMATLKEHGPEKLIQLEQETEWNWNGVIEYWDALDDLKETASRQDGKQRSRLGFLKRVIRFLEAQELIVDQGNDELILTEKARIIVQRYFMDLEYNRGILAFMYRHDQYEGDE